MPQQDTFAWAAKGLDQQRLLELATLLRTQNTQQEPSYLCDDEPGLIEALDLTAEQRARSNSKLDDDILKQRFLDRLAELVSLQRGSEYVASSAMVEIEENGIHRVTIVIVRNGEPFDRNDKDFLMFLEERLQAISSNRTSNTVVKHLWPRLVAYNTWRFDKLYLPKFKRRLKDYLGKLRCSPTFTWKIAQSAFRTAEAPKDFIDYPELGQYTEETHEEYMRYARKDLLELVSAWNIEGVDTIELRCHVAHLAYKIRHLGSLRILVTAFIGKSTAEIILNDIYFLGRLRAAYETFIEAAHRLPAYENLRIHPLGPRKLTLYPKRPFLHVESALKHAAITPSKADLETYFGPTNTLKEVKEAFQRHSRGQYWIHAEIQLLLHLSQQEGTNSYWKPFNYIGGSKLTCLLCFQFIRAHGQFKSRDSHGKIYSLWIVPETSGLKDAAVERIVSCLKIVETEMRNTLRLPLEGFREERSESCPGVTPTFAPGNRYYRTNSK